jgi:hypothetical protein
MLAKASTDLLALLAVTRFSKLVRNFSAISPKNSAECRLHKNCARAIVAFPKCPPCCDRQKREGFTLGKGRLSLTIGCSQQAKGFPFTMGSRWRCRAGGSDVNPLRTYAIACRAAA